MFKICPKVDTCEKLKVVMDKDFEIQLYPPVLKGICENCKEVNSETKTISD